MAILLDGISRDGVGAASRNVANTWTAVQTFENGIVLEGSGNVNTPLDLVKFIPSGLYERPNLGHYGPMLVEDAAITSGTAILTSADANFVAGDVNLAIAVEGAGVAGATLVTTIQSVDSESQVTLAATASTTVTNARATWMRVVLRATVGYHAVNSSDDAVHAAYEVKTAEAKGTGYKTRFSVEAGVDEAIASFDAVKQVSITNSLGGVPDGIGGGTEVGLGFFLSDATSTRASPASRTIGRLMFKWSDRTDFHTVVDLEAYAYGQNGATGTPGTQNVTYRLGRTVNTSGSRLLEVHAGDGTINPTWTLDMSAGGVTQDGNLTFNEAATDDSSGLRFLSTNYGTMSLDYYQGIVRLNRGYDALLFYTETGTLFARAKDADSGTTTRSCTVQLRGTYWTGAASAARDAELVHNVTGTAPASQIDFNIGGATRATLRDTGQLDLVGALNHHAGAAIALGGGAGATLGTVGGSGPTAAAQQGWLQVQIAGTNSWIPYWR